VEQVLRESVLAEKAIFRAGAAAGVASTPRNPFVPAAAMATAAR